MGKIGKWRGLVTPKSPLGAISVAYLTFGGSKGLGGLPVAQLHAKRSLERNCSKHVY